MPGRCAVDTSIILRPAGVYKPRLRDLRPVRIAFRSAGQGKNARLRCSTRVPAKNTAGACRAGQAAGQKKPRDFLPGPVVYFYDFLEYPRFASAASDGPRAGSISRRGVSGAFEGLRLRVPFPAAARPPAGHTALRSGHAGFCTANGRRMRFNFPAAGYPDHSKACAFAYRSRQP